MGLNSQTRQYAADKVLIFFTTRILLILLFFDPFAFFTSTLGLVTMKTLKEQKKKNIIRKKKERNICVSYCHSLKHLCGSVHLLALYLFFVSLLPLISQTPYRACMEWKYMHVLSLSLSLSLYIYIYIKECVCNYILVFVIVCSYCYVCIGVCMQRYSLFGMYILTTSLVFCLIDEILRERKENVFKY